MKTEYQILQEITRLENLDISPDVDYMTRINALLWVLNGERSAMCEANSKAVLDDVRALLECVYSFRELMLMLVESGLLTQGSATDLAIQDLSKLADKVSEHFS